jgi:hypothetical protein
MEALLDAWMFHGHIHANLLGMSNWNMEGANFLGLTCACALLFFVASIFSIKTRSLQALWILTIIMLSCHLPVASAFHDQNFQPARPFQGRLRLHRQAPPQLQRLKGGGRGDALAQPADKQNRIVLGKRNWWSLMTFSYINSLIKAGYDHPLEEEELPELPVEDSAVLHGKRLEDTWLHLKQEAEHHTSPNATITEAEEPPCSPPCTAPTRPHIPPPHARPPLTPAHPLPAPASLPPLPALPPRRRTARGVARRTAAAAG